MSEDRLRELLRATAAPVEPPYLAGDAWRDAARRTRRNRRVGLSVTAAVVVVIAVIAVTSGSRRTDRHPATIATATPGMTRLDDIATTIAPLPSAEGRLPLAATILPSTIDTDPADAVPLSKDPVKRAVGLFAPYPKNWPQAEPAHATILVLGDDGRMRYIDTVPIRGTRDGLLPAPMDATSLSYDGTVAAFRQPDDTVLTVDLTGRGHHRYELGQPAASVAWVDDDHRLQVDLGDRTQFIDVPGGHRSTVNYHDIAVPNPLPVTSGSRVTLTSSDPERGTAAWLSTYDASSGRRQSRWMVPREFGNWYGTGFVNHDSVVRASTERLSINELPSDEEVVNAVVALDLGTKAPSRILALPGTASSADNRYKLCCGVLGWPDGNAVLVNSLGATQQILAWNARSGSLWRVTSLSQPAQVALVPWLDLPSKVIG